MNPGRRGGKPPTNRLSYGAAELGGLHNYVYDIVRSVNMYCRLTDNKLEKILKKAVFTYLKFYSDIFRERLGKSI
jgi:hypothetical protein